MQVEKGPAWCCVHRQHPDDRDSRNGDPLEARTLWRPGSGCQDLKQKTSPTDAQSTRAEQWPRGPQACPDETSVDVDGETSFDEI